MCFKSKIMKIIDGMPCEYFTVRQLYGTLQTHSTAERRIIAQSLAELEADCLIVCDERNRRYRKAAEGEFGTATFLANPRGFGFLSRQEGEDLFVPARYTDGAFHRDVVLYRRRQGTEDEAEIVRVLQRGLPHIVGTYDKRKGARFVLPDDNRFISDIYIPPARDMGARSGQKVVAAVKVYPDDNRNSPEGEIIEVLGYPDEYNVDMLSVARSYGLSQDFPDECARLAATAPQCVSEIDIVGRRDLRGDNIFTVDGADAKDLDDAVSVRALPDGNFLLGVHIADVSHYVHSGDSIDKEAFRRGTSVYLPETVFPMLPRELSNGICSLFEQVDRLTLSCQMTIDAQGKVVDCDIFPSVIRSKHRMTYTDVQAILDGNAALRAKYADIVQDLLTMQRLTEILQRKRNARGNIDFSSKEVTFVYGEQGEVVDVVPAQHLFAHELIEEFMIVANESVAAYALNCGCPFVYRVHAKPDADKFAALVALMRGVGINVKRSREIHGTVLQDALRQAADTPYFNLINDVMLRTMQKAVYSADNTGHFGLASNCYCHFTSPIRRYPDLTVHRVLKLLLAGGLSDGTFAQLQQSVADVARQSNACEKNAVEAERRADDVKKCAYARTVIGCRFEAIVSGVTERGLYAELPNTVEGFIPSEFLPGAVSYDPQHFCLRCGNNAFSLGDSVTIEVYSVNTEACRVEFRLAR